MVRFFPYILTYVYTFSSIFNGAVVRYGVAVCAVFHRNKHETADPEQIVAHLRIKRAMGARAINFRRDTVSARVENARAINNSYVSETRSAGFTPPPPPIIYGVITERDTLSILSSPAP